MHYTIYQCAIVILAAGQSSRLGRPKQLLPFQGKSLLRHCAEQALATGLPVTVVIGANGELIRPALKDLAVTVADNQQWISGMSSSVRCGVEAAKRGLEDLDGILLMVSDQPFVSADLLRRILKVQEDTGAPIVSSQYGARMGVPALFHKSMFQELIGLQGDTGARKLIEKYKDEVTMVAFPEGAVDVDTLEEYNALLK